MSQVIDKVCQIVVIITFHLIVKHRRFLRMIECDHHQPQSSYNYKYQLTLSSTFFLYMLWSSSHTFHSFLTPPFAWLDIKFSIISSSHQSHSWSTQRVISLSLLYSTNMKFHQFLHCIHRFIIEFLLARKAWKRRLNSHSHKVVVIFHSKKHQLGCSKSDLQHSNYKASCHEHAYKISAQSDHKRLLSKCLTKIGLISRSLFGKARNFSDLAIFFLQKNHTQTQSISLNGVFLFNELKDFKEGGAADQQEESQGLWISEIMS